MRHLICLTALTAFVSFANAADPPLPKSADLPLLLMAKATKSDKGVVLHVRLLENAPATKTVTLKVPVEVQKVVNGKVVTETQVKDEQRQITVMTPAKWRTVEIPVDGNEVAAYDVKGQRLTPESLAERLADEKAILASPFGPIDPYFLQTTKDDTPIVKIPPERLFPPQNAPVRP